MVTIYKKNIIYLLTAKLLYLLTFYSYIIKIINQFFYILLLFKLLILLLVNSKCY